MADETNLYKLLGVHENAGLDDIKKAHRRLMRIHHPDLHQGEGKTGAAAMASRLNDAYATLSNPGQRARYDATLKGPAPTHGDPVRDDGDESTDTWGSEVPWDADPGQGTPQPQQPEQAPTWRDEASTITEDSVRYTTPTTGLKTPILIALGGIATAFAASFFLPPFSTTPAPPVVATLTGVGLAAGIALQMFSPRRQRKRATRPTLMVAIIVALALVGFPLLMGFTALAGGAAAAMCAFVGALVVVQALMDRKTAERLVKAQSLRDNNVFGGLPGGVGPDLLNQDLSEFFGVPSVRIMRNADSNGMFSHAVLHGGRVAFVKAVMGVNGLYRWSGPSLLVEPSGQAGRVLPQEVMRADYPLYFSQVGGVLPSGVRADAWVFVYTPDGGQVAFRADGMEGNPQVTDPEAGLDHIGRFLIEGNAANPTVDHETFLKVFSALVD